MTTLLLVAAFLLTLWSAAVEAFSSQQQPPLALFDRFRAVCPADPASIRQMDERLIPQTDEDDGVWAAVYRSSNNKPSVFVKDDFLNAMHMATTNSAVESINNPAKTDEKLMVQSTSSTKPVAVGRLYKSKVDQNSWMIDSLRCILKKENMDDSCDGGSEHLEALSMCIDTLLLHYFQEEQADRFEQALRCKATLVSSPLLEERGFVEITHLSPDMATHVSSSIDTCMNQYAQKIISAKTPQARENAMQMVQYLSKLDNTADRSAAVRQQQEETEKDEDDADDPWAGFKQFI